MRALCAYLISLSLGCASTVTRLDGELPTPAGPAKAECEKKNWLVVAPTRAQIFDARERRTELRDDGVGLYRIGARKPESIPGLADELGSNSESFARHGRVVRAHDTKQLLAGGLGAAGIVAIGIGTLLFVNAFGTESKSLPGGGVDEKQTVDTTSLAVGGVLVGIGFGLGITGVVINPSQAERAKAEAARYVFLPPEDLPTQVVEMVGEYNQRTRERCARPSEP
jgi:hypothetical protein